MPRDHSQQGLLKPRRLGVLGKAQRVVAGSGGRPPLAPAPGEASEDAAAMAAAAAAAAEANRKRKAEMEAQQSPKPLLSVGEAKRRQSPVAEEVSRPRLRATPRGVQRTSLLPAGKVLRPG